MDKDPHDFSLFRKDMAHPEADERFLTVDKQWLERQLAKDDLRTIIIDNTNKERAFSVCNNNEIGGLALKLENPKGEDIVCLGLSLFKISTAVAYLKFRNVQTSEQLPPVKMLLNSFSKRKLKCIYLERNIAEQLMLYIFDIAHISEKILLRCCNTTDKAHKKMIEIDNLAVGSDDEASAECAAPAAARVITKR